MKSRSLARQTVSIVLLAQLLCALALSGVALLHEKRTRLRAFDVQLQGRSDSLLGAIQDAEDAADNVSIDRNELRLPEEDVYAVYNQGGRLLGVSAADPAELITRGKDGFRNVYVGPRRYRVLQRQALRVIDRAEFGGVGLRRPVTIVYASPQSHVLHETVEGARFYLGAIALAAVLTALFVALLLRQALRPLTDLADAASRLSAPALQFDAPASVLRVRELQPLAEVLKQVTAGLRDAFAKEHRFVGDAAHELKTAIAVVRSSVQVLMVKQRSVEEYVAGLERVLEDSNRVETLVAQMLQLARLEEAVPAHLPLIDLGASAGAALAQLQPIAEQRGIALVLESAPGTEVRLPPESAAVLLSNLVLNAIQHSRKEAAVKVSVRREPSGAVKLEIVDEGSGIGPEALPHIFERFYREDASRSRQTGGTGLGLAICKSIVEAAGGTIVARSVVGQGTAVAVIFSVP